MLCALIVHGFYVLYIDPLAGDAMRTATATAAVPERTLAVILKDIEQEICIVLGLWSAWLLAFRNRLFENEGYLLEVDFLELGKVTEYSQRCAGRPAAPGGRCRCQAFPVPCCCRAPAWHWTASA